MALILLAFFRKEWPAIAIAAAIFIVWIAGDRHGTAKLTAYKAAEMQAQVKKQDAYNDAGTIVNQVKEGHKVYLNKVMERTNVDIKKYSAADVAMPADWVRDWNASATFSLDPTAPGTR